MEEEWKSIRDYPSYSISSFGEVLNHRTDKLMAKSKTMQGDYKVTLVDYNERVTRSIRVLVAEAFVDPPYFVTYQDEVHCDTVIILDNNKENIMVGNLAWRPSWFAWKYHRQFIEDQPEGYYTKRVDNVETGKGYPSIIDAGTKQGLLFEDLWRSATVGTEVYPSGHHYEFG